MADRRAQSKKPKKWPITYTFRSRWGEDDDLVQEARWSTMAKSSSRFGPPGPQQVILGPYRPPGTDQYRLVQLRCGGAGCGKVVGAVWAVDKQWQGSAFTWAELQRVDDAEARPATVTVNHLVLDDLSRSFTMRAECPRHGLLLLPVAAVLDRLVKAVDRITAFEKSEKLAMQPGASPDDATGGRM